MSAPERPGELTGKTAGRRRRGRLVRVAVGCLGATIGLLGVFRVPQFVVPIADPIELRILDWHALVRGTLGPPADITIVAIDEGSLERLGQDRKSVV